MKDFSISPASWHSQRERADAYRQFFNAEIAGYGKDSNWCDVTLTLRQGIEDGGRYESLTADKVSRCIKELMCSLNRRVYKNAYRRYNKRLACIPVIERGSKDRLHVHMLLQIPTFMDSEVDTFFEIIKKEWAKVRWSHSETCISRLHETNDVETWTKYILKDVVEDDQVLDLVNVHFRRQLH